MFSDLPECLVILQYYWNVSNILQTFRVRASHFTNVWGTGMFGTLKRLAEMNRHVFMKSDSEEEQICEVK